MSIMQPIAERVPRVEELRIVPAPATLKDAILDASRATSAWHEAALPRRFPPGFHETMAPGVDAAAYRDRGGRALAESPAILAAFAGEWFAGYLRLPNLHLMEPVENPYVEIADVWTVPAF